MIPLNPNDEQTPQQPTEKRRHLPPNYRIGDDGEMIPLDETGRPMPLAGVEEVEPPSDAPAPLTLSERARYWIIGLWVLLMVVVVLVGFGTGGRFFASTFVLPTVAARVPPATQTRIAQLPGRTALPNPQTRTAQSSATRTGLVAQETYRAQIRAILTAEFIYAAAILPMCDEIPSISTEAVVLFIVSVNDPTLGRVFRASADGSNLCQMPRTAITATFVGLSADGRGAIIQRESFRHHLDFFTGEIRSVRNHPTTPQPVDSQTVFQRGSLTLVSPVSGSTVTIELPPQVIGVSLSQWVVPTTAP
ncbi:MAG: hypothetical protein U0670_07195 [Anaerolineae bacterium]